MDPHDLFFDPNSGWVDKLIHYPHKKEDKRSMEINVLESGVNASYDPYSFTYISSIISSNTSKWLNVDLA